MAQQQAQQVLAATLLDNVEKIGIKFLKLNLNQLYNVNKELSKKN